MRECQQSGALRVHSGIIGLKVEELLMRPNAGADPAVMA